MPFINICGSNVRAETVGIIRYNFRKSFDAKQTITESNTKPSIRFSSKRAAYKSNGVFIGIGIPITLSAGADRFSSGNILVKDIMSVAVKIRYNTAVTVAAVRNLVRSSTYPPCLTLGSTLSIPLLYSKEYIPAKSKRISA